MGRLRAKADVGEGAAVLVSVVVPIYNRPFLAIETLESIRANTYRPIEIVAVDDGSTDETGGVLDAWALASRQWDFVVKVIHRPNGGAASARNAGIEAATGEFLSFLDSDDLLKPEMISELMATLGTGQSAYAYCMTEQTRNGKILAKVGKSLTSGFNSVPLHNRHTSALLIRRDALNKTGLFRTDLLGSEDWEFAARVKAFSGRGIFIRKTLTEYRIHDGPQLVKVAARKYAHSRERAIAYVHETLAVLPGTTSAAQAKCARLMLRNGLRYRADGDHAGFARCLATACRWSLPRQRSLIRAFALGLRLMDGIGVGDSSARG